MTSNEPPSMRTLFKFALPSMGLFMTLMLLRGDDQKLWAVFPLLLLVLYFSAVDIRMEGEHVYYRYFFSWRKLPSDISDVRCTLLPALGYIRFRHFFPPFGLLFFIIERGYGGFIPFRRTAWMQTMLSFSHLQQDEAIHKSDEENLKSGNERIGGEITRGTRPARVLYPLAGIFAGIVIPVPWQHWTLPVNLGLVSRFMQIQHNPVVLCFYVVMLAVLIIKNRSHHFANFGLGFMVGTIVAYLAHLH